MNPEEKQKLIEKLYVAHRAKCGLMSCIDSRNCLRWIIEDTIDLTEKQTEHRVAEEIFNKLERGFNKGSGFRSFTDLKKKYPKEVEKDGC